MIITANDITGLHPDVADAAVAGILRVAAWRTGSQLTEADDDAVEIPTYAVETVERTAPVNDAPESGWTYMRTDCKSRGQHAYLRGRLVIFGDEFGDEVLGARWELLGVYGAAGVKLPYAGLKTGGVAARGPSTSVVIDLA